MQIAVEYEHKGEKRRYIKLHEEELRELYSPFLLKFIKAITLRTMGLEVHDTGMRDRERNKTGNVRIRQHCGVVCNHCCIGKAISIT
jgi:hypothetical protein